MMALALTGVLLSDGREGFMGWSRRGFSVLVLCAAVVTVAPAQTSTHFGVLAGGTFSKFRGADKGILDETKTGIAAGVFVTVGLTPEFALQPEVLYVQKGSRSEVDDLWFKLSYLEIPILAKFRIPAENESQLRPHFYAGGALGLKIGCDTKSGPTSASCEDVGDRIKSTDFSIVFGVGADLGRVMIDARFDLGFTKIEDAASPDDVKNSTLYLLAGWTFRAPR